MALDLDRIRLDTPSANNHIHLDNAGAALMPSVVVERMLTHIKLEEAIGGYDAQDKVTDELEAVYTNFERLIGAKSGEVAVLTSATDAWDKAFYSLDLRSGDRVITGFNEYCSNFVALLHAKEKLGIEIVVINPDDTGDLDLASLEIEAAAGAKLIAISHVPSSSGQVNDVKAVGKIAKKHDIPYLLDTCQSLGQMKIDVADIGCDMAAFTTRKFLRGPRGIGALYVSHAMRKKLNPVFMTNKGAAWTTSDSFDPLNNARVFEAWERNVAAVLAFGEAVKYLLALDNDAVFKRIKNLSDQLRSGLAAIDGVTVTDIGANLSAIVTCVVAGFEARDVREQLLSLGITGQVASVFHTRLDMEARGIDESLRLSPHYYNTPEEIERTLEVIGKIIKT
ncbi:MAG: aminotransferase class V-fold PLP-dependent enzyme [Sphingomonadales bacterium]|nr:aminotransferase class V-fold PLP-dependent enzyme [Sphingomonadales bacterium]